MKKCLLLLALLALNSHAKEIGEFTNKSGGKTILTDADCPVDETKFYGLVTSTTYATQTFCWEVSSDKKTIVMYFPLNKKLLTPISNFEKRDAATDKSPYIAL